MAAGPLPRNSVFQHRHGELRGQRNPQFERGRKQHAGDFDLAAGTTLNVATDDYDFNTGASITGDGTINLSSGSMSFDGSNVSVSDSEFTVSNGRLNINAATTIANLAMTTFGSSSAVAVLDAGLTLTGTTSWEGGTFEGGQLLTIAGGSVAQVTSTMNMFVPVSNLGTVDLSGLGSLYQAGGNFTNQTGGVVELDGTSITTSGSSPQTFVNQGEVNASSGSGSFQLRACP